MKFAVFLQNRTMASAWYRYTMPFAHIQGFEAQVMSDEGETEIEVSDIYGLDGCYFLRPCHISHIQTLDAFKNMGKKVWIDFDDDLFAVPYDHTEWEFYQLDSTKKAIIECCKLADVITVTTDQIRTRLLSKDIDASKIHVVPNAIDDFLYPEPTPHNVANSDYICWRGGKTHDRDLKTIGPAAGILMKKNFRWIFMGHKPYALQEYLVPGQYSHMDSVNIIAYFARLKALNAPFHVIPLEDTGLNRAKSDIAYLEATWIGGSLVYQTQWDKDGVDLWTAFKNGDELVERVMKHARDPAQRALWVSKAQEHIREEHLLSKVNAERQAILKSMFIDQRLSLLSISLKINT